MAREQGKEDKTTRKDIYGDLTLKIETLLVTLALRSPTIAHTSDVQLSCDQWTEEETGRAVCCGDTSSPSSTVVLHV